MSFNYIFSLILLHQLYLFTENYICIFDGAVLTQISSRVAHLFNYSYFNFESKLFLSSGWIWWTWSRCCSIHIKVCLIWNLCYNAMSCHHYVLLCIIHVAVYAHVYASQLLTLSFGCHCRYQLSLENICVTVVYAATFGFILVFLCDFNHAGMHPKLQSMQVSVPTKIKVHNRKLTNV